MHQDFTVIFSQSQDDEIFSQSQDDEIGDGTTGVVGK
jgi:hypothetical protein